MGARRIKLLYTAGAVIITSTAIILACGSDNTKAIVIDPPASIAPMIRITDDPESGGMPCVNPEQFKAFWESYEQETVQEVEESTSALLYRGDGYSDRETVSVEADHADTAEAVENTDERIEETLNESEQETTPETTTTAVELPTEERQVAVGYPVYSVGGIRLGEALEQYLYNQLAARGKGYFYPIALCQLFQESRFNPNAVSPSGLDFGLAQIRITYWDHFARESGLVEYDILNPIDNLYVYAYLMCKYLDETSDDIPMSLSLYYSVYGGQYAAHYVDAVMNHKHTLQQIK